MILREMEIEVKQWSKTKARNSNLDNPVEVSERDIYSSLQDGDISMEEATTILLDAIELAKTEVDYLGYMCDSDDNWFIFASTHLLYRKGRLSNLLQYAREMNIDSLRREQPSNTNSLISQIIWKGKKSDLGRVYSTLGHLLDCSKTEWERHFIGKTGESMYKATDDHKGGNTRTTEIVALQNASRSMTLE